MELRPQVLRLYRQFVKTTARWPVNERRAGRDIAVYVRERVRTEFRDNANVSDTAAVQALLEQGKVEYSQLIKLINGNYKAQFKREKDVTFNLPQAMEQVDDLLSTTQQGKQTKKTWLQWLLD